MIEGNNDRLLSHHDASKTVFKVIILRTDIRKKKSFRISINFSIKFLSRVEICSIACSSNIRMDKERERSIQLIIEVDSKDCRCR